MPSNRHQISMHESYFGQCARLVRLYPQKLGELAVIPLAIDEFAQRSAWQLGHDDYPAVDRCIYDGGKNAILYGAYWSGWNNAAVAQWGIYAPRRGNRSNRRFSTHRSRRAA